MGFLSFLGDALGSLLNWSSNESTNAANAQNVAATNAANLQIARETNALNQSLNAENIAFQQGENEITRSREDNAVQRRASDLIAAGLSKTLAAGSAASANALQAPQNTFKYEKSAPMQAFQKKAFRLQNEQLGTSILENKLRQKELEIKAKELEYYGYPDWLVGLIEVLGLDQAKDFLKGVGDFFNPGDSDNVNSRPSKSEDSVSSSGTGLVNDNGLPGSESLTAPDLTNKKYEDLRDYWQSFRRQTDLFVSDGKLTEAGMKYANKISRKFGFSVEDSIALLLEWSKNPAKPLIDEERVSVPYDTGGGYAW